MDPSQQVTLYQENRVNMMLNNAESWSARVFLSERPVRMLLYNIGSWSVGDIIPEEPGHNVII